MRTIPIIRECLEESCTKNNMNLRCNFILKLFMLIFFVNIASVSKVKLPVLPLPADIALKTLKVITSIVSAVDDAAFRKEIEKSLGYISEQLEGIRSLVMQQSTYIIEKLSTKIDMETVKDFVRIVDMIDHRYEKEFLRYFVGNNTYENDTIQKYIQACVDSQSAFRQQLLLVEEYASTVRHSRKVKFDSVFTILHRAAQEEVSKIRSICNLVVSWQNMLAAFLSEIYFGALNDHK